MEEICGVKIMVCARLWIFVFLESQEDISTVTTISKNTVTIAKMMVLTKALQNSLSRTSTILKFHQPTNFELLMSTKSSLKKAPTIINRNGISVKKIAWNAAGKM